MPFHIRRPGNVALLIDTRLDTHFDDANFRISRSVETDLRAGLDLHHTTLVHLQHKDNPVDWQPWGAEAFDRARRENKPVFVSIGYSTCHWCHVMARESFQNPQTAALLNEHFVNVKVDREERPDVDRLCMAFVQAITGSGGWPMSVWMTPEGKPFFGGTYFPPDDRPGRPGFPSVIRHVAREWKTGEAQIRALLGCRDWRLFLQYSG